LVIEGKVGTGYLSNIALDDITVTKTKCTVPPACNFDNGDMCSWMNLGLSDNFDWILNRGNASASSNRPPVDHSQNSAQGYYVYMESRQLQLTPEKAYLLSAELAATSGATYCFNLSPPDALPPGVTAVPRNTFSTANPGSFTSSPTTFNCNFESNMCAWTNSTSDNYDWSWGKTASQVANGSSNLPNVDHTTNSGGGHFVYYNMRQGIANGVALLTSPKISASGPKCLRFWYNMNSNVKQLNIYIRKGSALSVSQKSMIGSQGPNWHEGYLNINETGTYQVVFSGVKGVSGIDGVIALDDITIADGICEVPSPSIVNLTASQTFSCDFEQPDLCKFTQDTTDDFDWTQQQRGTDTQLTGPENDHTYGTADGHYVFTEASDINGQIKQSGDSARLISPTFISVSEDICLNFFYHMYGQSMGTLNVRLRTGPNFKALNQVIWTMSGDLGNQWNIGEVTIPAVMISQNFQIVFEAVRGISYFSDIALDDVSAKLGPCASRATCNFDTDMCYYSDYPADYNWIRHHGSTDSDYTGPSADHTQGNDNGYYMYLEASAPHIQGQTAVLSSERLSPTNGSCFTFWYHMYGSSIGKLNILISITPTQNATVWSLFGDQGNQWLNGQAPIVSQYNSFFILIQGVRGVEFDGDIAIDDVGYQNSPCGTLPATAKQIVHILTPPPPVQTSTGPLDCTFETDMCSWVQSKTDIFDWQREATRDPSSSSGPTVDHSGSGFFAFIDSSTPRRQYDNAILNSPVTSGEHCFIFWYYMWGDHIWTLNLYKGPSKQTLLWTRQGTQGKKWLQANIYIDSAYAYVLQIEAIVGSGAGGDIAIDDISVTNSKCPEALLGVPGVSCNFELDFCGYVQDKTDEYDWTWHSGSTPSDNTGPVEDHTYGTSYGNQGPDWIKATVDITANSNRIDIIFEATTGIDYDSDTAIDDVVLRNGKCTSKGVSCNCDFQMGMCSWTNSQNDSMDWLPESGSTDSPDTGPQSDHTFGNYSGYYLFIETSTPVMPGDNAILQSELFEPENDVVCFHFFYNMYGDTIGSLRIWQVYYNISSNKLPEISRQVLWMLSGNQSQAWLEGVIPIVNSKQSYKILIEGVAGSSYTGDIAIDDISIIHGASSCVLSPANASPTSTVPPPTATPPIAQIPANFNCNFDTDICGWTQDTISGQMWIRYHGVTPSLDTGPTTDHTSGNGFYIYLETSTGYPGMKARLNSPLITPGAYQCFSFWYHMYGETVASLDVQLKGSNGTSVMIWQATGSHGDQWIQARIDIGDSTPSFANQIVLEAVQGSSITGDIAVDDVQLVPGLCSAAGSSPIDCDFENVGICGYMQDSRDQFDWTWSSGETSSDSTGPTSDHTYGTVLGHYMYTEASPQYYGDIARLWSQPFRPTPGQCLSFYYSMNGADMGTLSVFYGYLNQTANLGMTQLWSLSGDQSSQWLQQYVLLPVPVAQPVNIVFQGKMGPSFMSDMAIDDIKLLQFCPAPGECTFEDGLCGWMAPSSTFHGIDSQFVRATANSRIFVAAAPHPPVDHTTGTGNGTYMILQSDLNSGSQQSQNVSLVSDVIQATGSNGKCFHFWFNNYGIHFSTASLVILQKQIIWRLSSSTNTTSLSEAQAFVYSLTPLKIAFNVTLLGGSGSFTVDDFTFTDGYCTVKPQSAYVAGGANATIQPPVTPFTGTGLPTDCDFESGFCHWTQHTGDDQFDWSITSGATDTKTTGPSVDHTYKTDAGHYIYIESSSPRIPNDTAVIESPTLNGTSPVCLIFWYHMYGASINALNMYTKALGQPRVLLWTRHKNQGSDWIEAAVDLPNHALNIYSRIADISLISGSDDTADRCDFETDMCGYVAETVIPWVRRQGLTPTANTGPTYDHTYQTVQ
ncbi:unnamed protein product, partial [Candidula unifasciata]